MKRILAFSWFTLVMWLTAILPDFRPILRFRGFLLRPCFKRCGRNFQITRNVVIAFPNRISIGNDVFIGYSTWLHGSAGITIEDEVQFAPFCVVISASHGKLNLSYRWGHATAAPIHIGAGSWVSSHAVIGAGVRIGRGALIAANAVVLKDVPDHCIVGGVPAQVLREDVADDDPSSPHFGVPPSQLAGQGAPSAPAQHEPARGAGDPG